MCLLPKLQPPGEGEEVLSGPGSCVPQVLMMATQADLYDSLLNGSLVISPLLREALEELKANDS